MMLECAPGSGGTGRFVAGEDGRRWTFSGVLTVADAGPALEALKRRAAQERKPLRYTNVPAALRDLGELYGVAELLAD